MCQEMTDLRKRIEVLERLAALTMSSSRAGWHPDKGLFFSPGPNSEVTDMVAGHTEWDPGSLDKGG